MTPRERAAEVQAKRSAELEAVRRNGDLSPDGRRRHMFTVHERSKAELTKLRREQRDADEATRSRLVKAAFGAGTEPNFLEHVDRARKISSPAAALDELQLAELAGQAGYARAIALVADRHGWGDVVRRATEQAGSGVAAQQLREHLDQVDQQRTADMLTFSAITPAEVRGYTGPGTDEPVPPAKSYDQWSAERSVYRG